MSSPLSQLCRLAYMQHWNNSIKGKRSGKNTRFKRKYGITLDAYDKLLKEQNNCCAICKTNNPGYYGVFSLDHDHFTNEVRGLLCTTCNFGLGQFKDSIERLQQALDYLKKYKNNQ